MRARVRGPLNHKSTEIRWSVDRKRTAGNDAAHAVRDDVHLVVVMAPVKFSQSLAELLGMALN